jgi:F-type H+-transporting ATPase subunit gamma
MPTLLDFRRRIRSVKNTQQITRAMKFVAAARLRRAQEAALAARPYAKELVRVLRSTISRIAEPHHPLLARRPEEKVLALVLTGERGLAGAFNTNILRKAHEFFRANKNSKLSKGRDALRKAGFNIIAEYINVLARVEFGAVREISNLVTDLYAQGQIDSVYIIFSEFKTVMSANLTVEKLLPVDAAQVQEGSEGAAASARVDYIYEQPEEQLLDRLLPRYVESQVQRAMLESSAAEHAARMTAMESATKNAGDVIEALTLHMNKVRQAAITKEIIEIVSGATSAA